MNNKNRDNKLVSTNSSSEENFQDDQTLLSGEPFSIKSHWTFKARGWIGVCLSLVIVALAMYSGKLEGVFIWSPAFLLTYHKHIFITHGADIGIHRPKLDSHYPGFWTVSN